MELNNREIALLLWFAVALVLSIIHQSVRTSLVGLVRTAAMPQIIIPIGVMYAYLGVVVWLLHTICLWDWDQLKNTIVWSFAVGIASFFSLQKMEDNPHYFRGWIKETAAVVVFVEFLVNVYTFPLLVEIIIYPLIFFVLGMIAVGKREPKHAVVVVFLERLMLFFGAVLILYTIYMIASNLGDFVSLQTLRDFYTPVILSLFFLPFIYILHVYSVFESVFSVLPLHIENVWLRRYAKLAAILRFHFRGNLLRRWQRHIGMTKPQDRHDIHQSIRAVIDNARRERKPIAVPEERGWSPHLASTFLQSEGLVPADYHLSYDIWSSSSALLDLGDTNRGIKDSLAYYIEGDELVATRLHLSLSVFNPELTPDISEAKFQQVAKTLLDEALGLSDFELTKPQDWRLKNHRVSLRRTEWQGGIKGGYDWNLLIEVGDHA